MRRLSVWLMWLYLLLLGAYLLLRVTVTSAFTVPPALGVLHTFAHLLFLPLMVVLPVSLLLRQRRLFVVTALLCLVPLGWGFRHLMPRPTVASAERSLSVMTFNMHGSPEVQARLEPYLLDLEPDIVFLQEISDAYASGDSEALERLYPYRIAQEAVWGNMLLSRYPITDYENLSPWLGNIPQRAEVSINDVTVVL